MAALFFVVERERAKREAEGDSVPCTFSRLSESIPPFLLISPLHRCFIAWQVSNYLGRSAVTAAADAAAAAAARL